MIVCVMIHKGPGPSVVFPQPQAFVMICVLKQWFHKYIPLLFGPSQSRKRLWLRKRVSVAHITRYLLVPGILIFGSVLPGKCFYYCSAPLPPFVFSPSPPLSLSPSFPLSSLEIKREQEFHFCHQSWADFKRRKYLGSRNPNRYYLFGKNALNKIL